MAATLAMELRARLRGRHDALKRMGWLRASSEHERAWWCPESADCWWMIGASPSRTGKSGEHLRFRDGAEALVLLNALALIDFGACVEVAESMRSPTFCCSCGAGGHAFDMVRRSVLGYAYHIYTSHDVAPISERVLGVQSPSQRFLNDFGRIKNAMPRATQELWIQPIPVQIHIHLAGQRADELARLLRQVLHAAIAQRLRLQAQVHDDAAQAAAATRFRIVDICLEKLSSPFVNIESLDCLARLTRLGVRVRYLPPIAYHDLSAEEHISLVASLQVLMLPQHAQGGIPDATQQHVDPSNRQQALEDANGDVDSIQSRRGGGSSSSPGCAVAEELIPETCLEHVHVTCDMTARFIPGFFSAVQVSRTVNHVELEEANDDELGALPRTPTIALWQWTAYALFSRHADHNVKKVTLHVGHFSQLMLNAVEAVLCAENPLDVLYNTMVKDDCRVLASRFQSQDPGDSFTNDRVDEDTTLYRCSEPQVVRVIDKSERSGLAWWRVLLPGCGEAWVKASDAIEVEPSISQRAARPDDGYPPSSRHLHLVLQGVFSSNTIEVLGFLRLVALDLGIVEVEMVENFDEEFDVTEWTLELLRVCPHLEQLHLPWYAEINRLRDLVEAAEAGHCRLRALSLRESFDSDASDLIEFLGVLCDAGHPLTRRLEELHIGVEIPTSPARDFGAAWQRLLQCNRTLHTITLWLYASKSVETSDDKIAIRTGPLGLASKLAFLSILYDPTRTGSARTLLDTSVLAIVFAFAAQHRERKIKIDLDESDDSDDE